ncbi:MAG: hypothetical protein QOJ52_4100 [Acidimicrobiaceae bacterium]|nr:hypothetical protein [Acidimicrobiaceae bacterium]
MVCKLELSADQDVPQERLPKVWVLSVVGELTCARRDHSFRVLAENPSLGIPRRPSSTGARAPPEMGRKSPEVWCLVPQSEPRIVPY